jgi:lysozyme
MKISKNGIRLIKEFEGYKSKPYYCAAGKLTIGYGHVIKSGEKLKELTEDQATELLIKDINEIASYIKRYIKVELTQNQIDAILSFVFNIGNGAFLNSTFLKKLNKNDFIGASQEFLKWNKIARKGKKISLEGLTNRRVKEMNMFIS